MSVHAFGFLVFDESYLSQDELADIGVDEQADVLIRLACLKSADRLASADFPFA